MSMLTVSARENDVARENNVGNADANWLWNRWRSKVRRVVFCDYSHVVEDVVELQIAIANSLS